MIDAKVIADSVTMSGDRLTTVEAKFPRYILPQVNTHRAFSRNVASNRAIPTKKLIAQIREDLATPNIYRKNAPGMKGGDSLSFRHTLHVDDLWRQAAEAAIESVETITEFYGVHKETVNRLLEPFLWTTAIITSSEPGWDNFFEQRRTDEAQDDIAALAEDIHEVMQLSTPYKMKPGHWHAPYITMEDLYELQRMGLPSIDQLKISVARCARVSYLTHAGKRNLDQDLALYGRLIRDGHWSPLEHVATPAHLVAAGHRSGNFSSGWSQLRHLKHLH